MKIGSEFKDDDRYAVIDQDLNCKSDELIAMASDYENNDNNHTDRIDRTDQTEHTGFTEQTDDVGVATPYSYASENSSEYRPGGYHPVSVGDCFQQRYYAIKKVGWGHYSTVWLCFDTNLKRYCAIKMVKSAELYAESARHEIKLLKHISSLKSHPLRERLVNLSDSFSTSGVNGTHQCLVFDVHGDNMLMLIHRSNYRGLPIYNVKQIAFQVLQGLSVLHDQARIIHTDLKPENVLIVSDDSSLREIANVQSKKYLDEHAHQLVSAKDDDSAKLSKTAKRRLRAKTKQTVSFFEAHRKWLRSRGIFDLILLANRDMLKPKMAVDAITGKLPFLPYDGPTILDDAELQMFADAQAQLEKVGDTAFDDLANQPMTTTSARNPQLSSPQSAATLRSSRKRIRDQIQPSTSKALKLLNKSTEKFMRYVQKCVDKTEKPTNEPHYTVGKRMKSNKKPVATNRASNSQVQVIQAPKPIEPNYNLINRKDPAIEPCKVKVVIADVGNSCFIDHHITEDIQTREYRAVEVILGAEYDTSADLWSAACLFWELATGEYLFEPNKWRDNATLDEVHIAHIIEVCGQIPRHLIKRGEYAAGIFAKDGGLHNIKTLSKRPLALTLIKKFNWMRVDAFEFANFLMLMLNTDPQARITAKEACDHPWLKLDREPK